jgi:cell volume regulation protein A
MSVSLVFALLGGLLVLAVVAHRLFYRTRIPDVIVLMAVGLLLGPIFEVVRPAEFQPITHAFGTLAVILILFEAGLDLDLRDTLRHFPGGLLLAILSYTFGIGLIAFVLAWSLNLPRGSAVLAAAALACISSSITLPILQQIELSKPVQVTMLLEASLSDALAVLTVGILLQVGGSFENLASSVALGILLQFAVSLILAFLVAALWSYLLPKLSEQRFWQVLTFAVVLLLYAGTEHIHGNGLIAVLGFGLALANFRRIDPHMLESSFGLELLGEHHHSQMLSFHSELAFLVRTFFFVLIGVLVQFRELATLALPALGITGAIIASRWLATLASRRSRRSFKPVENEVVFWIMPRGLITVVLALQIIRARGMQFEFLTALAFASILLTNFLVVVGSIRARRLAAQPAPAVVAPEAPPDSEG